MNQASTPQNPMNQLLTQGWSSWLISLLQLIAVALLIHSFALEPGLHLLKLTSLLLGAFVIQPLIPIHLRTWFFIIVSIVGLFLIAGWFASAMIIGFGFSLILTSRYIPSHVLRYSIIGLMCLGLILLFSLNIAWVTDHTLVFSILGSMFMFRLSIYLYDQHHLREKSAFETDLAYFFMLPNMAILLFPAVDYKTFTLSRRQEYALLTYKKGVQWLVLGVFHLILYRIIYYYAFIPASEVRNLLDFTQYALTNYALIIRLSGIFHFAVGSLCLFGFNLPQVFNNYFLASGFSDLWRRINIYFRDYLIKVFYYPIFFRLRRYGTKLSMSLTIIILFFITWMLHSFQWFWLKGHFPLKATDGIFWGIFGVLVMANALVEMRKKNKNENIKPWKRAGIKTMHIVGMLVFMSILWSLWSANSLQQWWIPVSQITHSTITHWAILMGGLFAAWILGAITYYYIEKYTLAEQINPAPHTPMATFWSVSIILLLFIPLFPPAQSFIKQQYYTDLSGVLTAKLNASDELLRIEGYYSEILVGNDLTSPLSHIGQPETARLTETNAKRFTGDFRFKAIEPNIKMDYKGESFSTNRWGMRDRDYELIPNPNTTRYILMGGSFVVGSGVSDSAVFNRQLEILMNEAQNERSYEFMNFGCASYDLIDCILHFEVEKLDRFQANYLLFFTHGIDIEKSIRDLTKCVRDDIPIPYPFLEQILHKAGIHKEMPVQQIEILLEPYGEEIITQSYQYLYNLCKTHKIKPIVVFWPPLARFEDSFQGKVTSLRIASKIGFTILDFAQMYNDYELEKITVSSFDMHPNDLAHALMAKALFHEFSDNFQNKERDFK